MTLGAGDGQHSPGSDGNCGAPVRMTKLCLRRSRIAVRRIASHSAVQLVPSDPQARLAACRSAVGAAQIAGSGAMKLDDWCVVMCLHARLVAERSRWKSSCWSLGVAARDGSPGLRQTALVS